MQIVGIVFLGTGLILSLVGAAIYLPMQNGLGGIIGGGVCGGLGVVFTLIGVFMIIRSVQQRRRNEFIMRNGIDSRGTVTFVDRNFAIRIILV